MAQGDPEDQARRQGRNPADDNHRPSPRPKAPAADNHPADTKAPATQWDVALYLVQRFPIYAIVLAFFAAGAYGANVVLTQLYQAQGELEKARQQIDEARSKADIEIAAAKKSADERIAAANQREQEAAQKVATAQADALSKVQDTLLTASLRVQQLVAGQITSMEQLEDIRQKTSAALTTQIADLTAKRDDLQKTLSDQQQQVRVAKVDFALDNLERKINDSPYSFDTEFGQLLASFTSTDTPAIEEVQRRISSATNADLTATLQLALAITTQDSQWSNNLATTIGGEAAISEAWFRSVFRCCDHPPPAVWLAIKPAIAQFIAAPERSPIVRLAALDPFLRESGSLDLKASDPGADDAWKIVAFVIGIVRGDFTDVEPSDRGQAAYALARIDLSAGHVWMSWIAASDQAPIEEKNYAEGFAQGYAKTFPALGQFLAGPPPETVRLFWSRADLATNHKDYADLDLSAYDTSKSPGD